MLQEFSADRALTPFVHVAHLTKRFPGVVALDDVSFEIGASTCHALCGENGAGKSTLGRILAGIFTPDGGTIRLGNEQVHFSGPADAIRAGVAIVHQELAFCENLSVAENLCLGALPSRGLVVSRRKMRERAAARLATIGAAIDVDAVVGALTIAEQQLLQIAAAVSGRARLIVFDEPTSSLSQHEAERLYGIIAGLKAQGVTCIYVSHRLEEILRLCDAVTVLRDGRHVGTVPISEVDQGRIVEMMIGRRLDQYFPAHVDATPGSEVLRVEGLSSPPRFHDVSFALRAGEVLGFAGLVGAGRTEVARALFGLDRHATGRVWIGGEEVSHRSPAEAIQRGLGLVPEDRKRQGLVLPMSTLENATLAILDRVSALSILKAPAERAAVAPYFSRLGVESSRQSLPVAALSGGNQQKVVLTKWLARQCRILILDEPTRGIDVGAKAEIHALVDELAAGGLAILLISSDMPEILNLSTRVLVFREGRVVGKLSRADATQDVLMRLMAGIAA
jgi:ABC-type sugar transport system ATPase subunit